MFSDQDQILSGATVYDASGDKIGTVHENNAQGGYLVVQKGWLFPKDFYVPMDAVERADADGVFLRVGTAELSNAQYDEPPVMREGTIDTSSRRTAATVADRDVETATGDIRVPVREEELVVGKRMEEEGRVHIHKEVITEQQTVSVPLRQEQVTIERVAVRGDMPVGDDAFVERDIEVPVMGEEAVVGKRVAGVEEVVIHKDVVTEQERVSDTVRKERVVVDGVDTEGRSTAGGRTVATGVAGSGPANAAQSAANTAGGAAQSAGSAVKGAAQNVADDLGQAKDKLTGR